MIFIASAGLGNIASVRNMIAKAGGGEVRIVSEPDGLRDARSILLPGVGSFDAGMNALRQNGLDAAIIEAGKRGARILGICLGMPMLFSRSEEGSLPGLGLIPGRVERFKPAGQAFKVPHVGWNMVRPTRASSLFEADGGPQRFYHVHSYHAVCEDPSDVTAITHYGYDFASAVQRGQVMGVQFHPEKSHRFGIALMKRFVGLDAC